MGLRGETVGTAYVRILADGSGLDKSIKDEVDNSEESFTTAGEKSAVNYKKGFDDEVEKRPALQKLQKQILREAGKFDAVGELVGDETMDGLERAFRKRFGDEVGTELGRRLRATLIKTMNTASVDDFVENLARHASQVVRDISDQETRAIEELNQKIIQSRVDADKLATQAEKDAKAARDRFEKDFRASLRKIDAESERITKDIEGNQARISSAFRRAGEAINRFGLNAAADLEKFSEALKRGSKSNDRDGRKLSTSIRNLGDNMQKFSDIAGTAFGRGSRNNFLNFFGSVVRNVSSLPSFFVKATSSVVKFGENFGKVTEESTSFATKMKTVGTAVLTAATSLASLGIAAGLVVIIIGPLASLVSTLAGAVVALAGSLAFAAAAGFGVLLGSMLPVLAAVGGITLAFKGLDKQMKKTFKEAFKPIKDTFQDLADIAAKNIFGPFIKTIPVFNAVLKSMTPLVDSVTVSLGGIPAMFAKIVQSPAFTKFQRQMGKFLPDAVDTLGQVFANVFKGMLGLFRSVIPITEDFFDWLRKITGKFRDFTNSTKGQRELKHFFEQAATSAQSVIGFVDNLADSIGELLGSGRKSGNKIFDDLTEQLQNFIDFLNQNPDAVKNWFRDSVDTVRAIGDAIKELGKVFDTLDSPENRKNIVSFFHAVGTAAKIMAFIFKHSAIKALLDMASAFVGMFNGTTSVKDGLKTIGKAMLILIAGPVAAMIFHFLHLGDRIKDVAHFLKENMGDAVHAVIGFFRDLPGHLRDLADKMRDVGTHLVNAIFDGMTHPEKIASFALELANALKDKLGDLVNWIIDALNDAIPNSLSVPGPDIPLPDNPIPHLARGGIVNDPRFVVAGEDGPEAIVPLKRSLSRVDPSVRALSAIAQGLANGQGAGKHIDVGGLTVITPTENPVAVATETVNQLAASGYF